MAIPGAGSSSRDTHLSGYAVASQSKGFTMLAVKLYAAGTATADNIASAIIPVNSKIVGVQFALRTLSGGATVEAAYELSQQSTSQFTVNDARNIIAQVETNADNAFYYAFNVFVPVPGLQVKSGDKIYLHRLAVVAPAAGTSISLNIWLV